MSSKCWIFSHQGSWKRKKVEEEGFTRSPFVRGLFAPVEFWCGDSKPIQSAFKVLEDALDEFEKLK